MKLFETEIEVGLTDLDELDHVNNVRYVQWIQDVSKAHWEQVVPETVRQNLIWVVRRHDIRYKGAALLGDRIKLRTYVGEFQGYISKRIVEMRHAETGKLVVKAQTDWCLLNKESGKPMTISEEIHTLFKTPSP